MNSPFTFGDFLALLATTTSVVVFVWIAFGARKTELTYERYMLADRTLGRNAFGSTLVATGTSLATVILFFLATEAYYGWTLIFCSLLFVLSQIVFIWVVTRHKIDIHTLTTNADFWLSKTGDIFGARVISVISAVCFLFVLFLELYVGAGLLKFFGVGFFGDGNPFSGLISFSLLAAVVVGYVGIGGFKAVVETDVWQTRMMVAAVFALLLFAFFGGDPNANFELARVADYKVGVVATILFWLHVLVLNLTLPFSQTSSWQRIAAARSATEVGAGIKKMSMILIFIWAGAVIAFVVLRARGLVAGPDMPVLLNLIRGADNLSNALLYPLVFCGFVSAVFSTADTALSALHFCLADQSTFKDKLMKFAPSKRATLALSASIGTMLVLIVIYFLAESVLKQLFIPLTYSVLGAIAVCAPQLLFALTTNLPRFTPAAAKVNALAMGVAWLIVFVAGPLRAFYLNNLLGFQEAAFLFALLVSSCGLWIGVKLSKAKAVEIVEPVRQ